MQIRYIFGLFGWPVSVSLSSCAPHTPTLTLKPLLGISLLVLLLLPLSLSCDIPPFGTIRDDYENFIKPQLQHTVSRTNSYFCTLFILNNYSPPYQCRHTAWLCTWCAQLWHRSATFTLRGAGDVDKLWDDNISDPRASFSIMLGLKQIHFHSAYWATYSTPYMFG